MDIVHYPSCTRTCLMSCLTDDYYMNIIDWSSGGVVAVALSCTLYLWNADSGEIQVEAREIKPCSLVLLKLHVDSVVGLLPYLNAVRSIILCAQG